MAKEIRITEKPLVKANDPRLWNVQELAAILGVSREFVIKMKRYGFKMPLGRASVPMAHKWMEKNADLLNTDEETSDKD